MDRSEDTVDDPGGGPSDPAGVGGSSPGPWDVLALWAWVVVPLAVLGLAVAAWIARPR